MAMDFENDSLPVHLSESMNEPYCGFPSGIRAIEQSLATAASGQVRALISGYLKDCNDMETFQQALSTIEPVMVHYASAYLQIPPHRADHVARLEIPTLLPLLEFCRSATHNRALLDIFNTKEDIDVSCVDVGPFLHSSNEDEKHSALRHIVTMITLIKILNLIPFHFFHFSEFNASNGGDLPNTEDLHRAFCLLRFWTQCRNDITLTVPADNARADNSNPAAANVTPADTIQGGTLAEEPVRNRSPPLTIPGDNPELLEEPNVDVVEPVHEVGNQTNNVWPTEERFPPLIDEQKVSLLSFAKEKLMVRRDPRQGIAVPFLRNSNEAKTTHLVARYARDIAPPEAGEQPDTQTNEILDGSSMQMIPYQDAAVMLGLDPERPVLFAQLNNELSLFPHQVRGVAVMLERERNALCALTRDEPCLKMGILADAMGLGKTIQILTLVWTTYSLGMQVTGPKVPLLKPTLVAIPPAAALSWYSDYQRYFTGKLKVYFVGHSLRNTSYQSHCIDQAQFKLALDDPTKSDLYSSESDRGRTVFIISHFTIAKYTLLKEIEIVGTARNVREGREYLGNDPFDSAKRTVLVRKQSTGPEPLRARSFWASAKYDIQTETYSSLFAGVFHRVVIDDGHMLRQPGSDFSRSIKLLEPDFWWVATATPLLNRTFDMYGYCHLVYNRDWNLQVSEHFKKRGALECFKAAASPDEVLSLFDPLRLLGLAKDRHIAATRSAVSIPVLLRQCMIRRTLTGESNVATIGPVIPANKINGITLAFDSEEQEEYCHHHLKLVDSDSSVAIPVINSEEDDDLGLCSTVLKSLMSISFSPKLGYLHERFGLESTEGKTLGLFAKEPFYGLEIFLDKIKDNGHVPQTRETRARELLSLSPSLRYIAQLIGQVVDTSEERLVIFVQTPVVAWLITMFCLNWGARTAWLRAGVSHSERDRILSDFNNPTGETQIFISSHKIAGFGINLQSSGCRNMIIAELPRNLNSLLQTCARLTRIGQTHEVQVYSLFIDHSFHRWWSANLARKAVSDISMQLQGGQRNGENLDSDIITQRAQKILNSIMDWDEDRTSRCNLKELDLEQSSLSKEAKRTYSAIGAALGKQKGRAAEK